MKQTAVQWLELHLFIDDNWKKIFEKAKEMEKEQIIKAWDSGYNCYQIDEELEINKTMFSGKKHYNDIYNK